MGSSLLRPRHGVAPVDRVVGRQAETVLIAVEPRLRQQESRDDESSCGQASVRSTAADLANGDGHGEAEERQEEQQRFEEKKLEEAEEALRQGLSGVLLRQLAHQL